MADGKRQQLKEVESHVNTRQDRNLFLTTGGTLTWDTITGILTWDAALQIWVGGVATAVVNPGDTSAVPLTTLGDALYVDLDRVSGGGVLSAFSVDSISNSNHSTDNRLLLGTRGGDGKFYWRNGTVMSHGDSKTFGTLQSSTDRNEVTSTGVATVAVGFTYLVGANQLVVYVGGILQIEGVHYTETPSDTEITFTAGNIPTAGELITFINVVGGQGPAGSTLVPLQTAYDNGEVVEVSGSASTWWKTPVSAAPGPIILGTGDAAPPGYTIRAGMTDLGWFQTTPTNPATPGEAGVMYRDGDAGGGDWQLVPLDDGSGDTLLINTTTGDGIRLSKGGEGIEFGNYPGSYPDASVWSGDGPVRWSVYSGTLAAGTPAAEYDTGLTDILGVVAVVEDPASGVFMALENEGSGVFDRRFAVTFDAPYVRITRETNATGDVGLLIGAAYNLVVFHQGA